MDKQNSNRIIVTPSYYAKTHYLYVQEAGTLQSIEPHISKRDNLSSLLFFIVLQGSGILNYKGKRHTIQKGDCIFIDCLEEYSHESSKEDPWKLSWVHFYGKDAIDTYKHYLDQGGNYCFRPNDFSQFSTLLDDIFRTQTLKPAFYEQYSHKCLTDLFMQCYMQINGAKENRSESTHEKILAIRAYLDENYYLDLDLDDLSAKYFISKYHLLREFKKITGLTPVNYLNSRRINEAKKQLRFSQDSIGSIAASCGISDVNYFTKVFSKYEGMTPSAYRKKW